MKTVWTRHRLFCFSPPVMIATVVIELGLAALIIIRHQLNTPRRVMIAILVCLGGFQLAEYSVCGQHGNAMAWSRAGYVLITMLPALGLHLVALLYRSRSRLVYAAYAVAIGFAGIFAIAPNQLNQHVCTGNYVIFLLGQPLDAAWSSYYMAFVLIAAGLAALGTQRAPRKNRRPLFWLCIGYLSFTAPSFLIYYLAPAIGLGLPSIMCGFAVILAVIIGLKIAPQTNQL